MEKSQKQIKILTKGGEEVTLRFREIFPLTDDQLTGLVDQYLPGYLDMWGHDDDLDYEPYNTIFGFLTGQGHDNYYTNLFEKLEVDDELEDEIEYEGFIYNGKEYDGLMELVDEWLNDNYPKAFTTGLNILQAWEYGEASNFTEERMLSHIYHRHLGEDADRGYKLTPEKIILVNGYKGESYMKDGEYITYEIKEEGK